MQCWFFLSMLLETCSSQAGRLSQLWLQSGSFFLPLPNQSLLVLSIHLPTTPTLLSFLFLLTAQADAGLQE